METFIKFWVVPAGEFFTDDDTLHYRAVLGKTQAAGNYPPGTDFEPLKRKIIVREIIETVQKMVTVRTNIFVIGYMKNEQVAEVRKMEAAAHQMKGMADYDSAVLYLRDVMLPLLFANRPGKDSKYRENYMIRYDALRDCAEYIAGERDKTKWSVELYRPNYFTC